MKDEIIVRYCLGKSPEEIAKELDLSLEFVKLSLSLEILKQTFRKYMSEQIMTLEEAIIHCKEKACDNTQCVLEHRQLAEWL